MFSIPYIIGKLYPEESVERKKQLSDTCLAQAVDYSGVSWQGATEEMMEDEMVQLNIIRTIELSQYNAADDGIMEGIMQSLEEWSSGQIVFPKRTPQTAEFLERLYPVIGYVNFSTLSTVRQSFLLGGRFLLFGCIWEVPLYAVVESAFETVAFVSTQKQMAGFMRIAMETNQQPLGTQGRGRKSIADWVRALKEFHAVRVPEKVTDYMENSLEVQRLAADDRQMLEKILTVYYALETGFIYRDIQGGDSVPPPGFEKNTNGKPVDFYDAFLDKLYRLEPKRFAEWLSDYAAVARWLDLTGADDIYIRRLLFVLKEKIDVSNSEQISHVVGLFEELEKLGAKNINEVMYFDEQKGSFVWDEEFFAGMTEDVIINPPPSQKNAQGSQTQYIDVTQVAPTIGQKPTS
ncbi:MAG: hypothetical protein COU35_03615 [Candidatus Magasanikbacteria bacterium CG10_big_fil_rev_8_21_14_0_10_47_10]|uniref:Uncharacterized protein n=1 Tax=Candidatus Magasanikbacteria bacterium CG10_big_fil_rev_8_21_14_0_10_47_10 TaxID=1974652 RepID=A0A2H0TPZ8_9BACT|nr:MAG: hypothetical protein COU35_03615 [Candidatus Magasanikbacteria bacterium CG10_big_fil_rev_8_21_14_0_10_47_10]